MLEIQTKVGSEVCRFTSRSLEDSFKRRRSCVSPRESSAIFPQSSPRAAFSGSSTPRTRATPGSQVESAPTRRGSVQLPAAASSFQRPRAAKDFEPATLLPRHRHRDETLSSTLPLFLFFLLLSLLLLIQCQTPAASWGFYKCVKLAGVSLFSPEVRLLNFQKKSIAFLPGRDE